MNYKDAQAIARSLYRRGLIDDGRFDEAVRELCDVSVSSAPLAVRYTHLGSTG